MAFYGFVITDGGKQMLAQMIAGEKLEITKVVMEKGTAESADAARLLTAPIDPGPNGTSTIPIVSGNTVKMVVEYRSDLNGGLQEEFWIGGFAVFAKTANVAEKMVYYGSLGDAKQHVAAYTQGTAPDVRRYPVSISVTAGIEVDMNYPAEAWMTADDVADFVDGTLKPELMETIGKTLSESLDAEKGIPGGLATLGPDGKIPVPQIPPLPYIPTEEKGAANGVAPLGPDAKIPAANMPAMDYIPLSQKGQPNGVVAMGPNGLAVPSQIDAYPQAQNISTGTRTALGLGGTATPDAAFDALVPRYGTSTTVAATAAKVATVSGFKLFPGVTASIRFTYANTAANPTLNVNSTGAKPLFNAATGTYVTSADMAANMTADVVYNGTQWVLLNALSTQIATGSYVGTGAVGAGNQNQITTPFRPKAVFVSRSSAYTLGSVGGVTSTAWVYGALLGVTHAVANNGAFSPGMVTLIWADTGVSWYYAEASQNNAVSRQLNDSGITFSWVAIG